MSAPVKISIPASVAAFVRPGTALEDRLRGAGGVPALPPREQMLLLFCLSKDADPLVRDKAHATLSGLPEELVLTVDGWGGAHPALLHQLAQSHGGSAVVAAVLGAHPALAEATRALLVVSRPAEPLVEAVVEDVQEVVTQQQCDPPPEAEDEVPVQQMDEVSEGDAPEETEEDTEVNEEDEEFLSKYKLAQVMGIGEKIKMALTGDKEWRKILIKDSNKLVSSGVLKNPRITEPEVLNVLKSGAQNDEIMRLICANREWVKNYPIRKALVENPKTPLANALRFLGSLNEKDIANYAKSRNVSSVISTQAKRMLLNKKK